MENNIINAEVEVNEVKEAVVEEVKTEEVKTEEVKKPARKANGKKSAPKKIEKSEATVEAPAPEKKQKKEKKEKVEKAPQVKVTDRRDALKATLKLTDSLQFEDEITAIKKENSATFTQDNAIMLTKKGDEKKKATRVLEVWLHKTFVDVCISKKLFDSITSVVEDATDDQKRLAANLEVYREKISENRKSHKYVLVLNDDNATSEFVNLLIKAL